jgi:5-methyltetrahydrofolate--homocysteine methyltransferase
MNRTDAGKDELVRRIGELMEEEGIALAREMLAAGYNPLQLLGHCREAMEIVGQRYDRGEYFLPELMLAGDMLKAIGEIARPLIRRDGRSSTSSGKVVIGTVHGDLHDIGKNIVTFMLEVNDFEVIDLGIDVPAARFVDTIREYRPQVVGLSGFLTIAFQAMKETVDAVAAAGLRDGLRIMIGGGQVDEGVKTFTGADGFGLNALEAVALCRGWLST